ncbi:hypothetical protein [Tsukamurella tyrosinosolvens]|uniref:hypothetical protein n=1 Tax=Tsukamurella tyrosinosolvens TaxID=57704 RepID=UPI003F49F902
MAKTRKITLQLRDGGSREFVGDDFYIDEPNGPTGLMEVRDREKNETIWKEGFNNGARDVVKVEITNVDAED